MSIENKIIQYIKSNRDIANKIVYMDDSKKFIDCLSEELKKELLTLKRDKVLRLFSECMYISFGIVFEDIMNEKIKEGLFKKDELSEFYIRDKADVSRNNEGRFKKVAIILNKIAMKNIIFKKKNYKTSMGEQILFFLTK